MRQIVFTASDNFLGRAIRFLTEEPVSHVALRFGELVVHATAFGVTACPYLDIAHKVVYAVDSPHLSPDEALSKRRSLYDYGALLYLGLRYLLKKYLKISLPKANLWAASGMYTCTEFATQMLDGEPDSLITPFQLYILLRARNGL